MACDADPARPETSPAVGAGFAEPWQPVPFPVPADLVAAAEAACRAQGPQDVPADAQLALVDARGEARLTLIFSTAGLGAWCDADFKADRGWFASASVGLDTTDPGPNEADVSLTAGSTDMGIEGAERQRSAVLGRVGPGVAGVDIIRKVGAIKATVANRWFVAWWPSGEERVQIQAKDANGLPLGPSHD